MGFLPPALAEYLRLLDGTRRQIRRDQRGAMPADLVLILAGLQVIGEAWVDPVQRFARWYRLDAGRATKLADAAHRWLRGMAHRREAFR